MEKYAIGTDIGGSHISCSLVDLNEGKLIKTTFAESDVDNKADSETILSVWAGVLKRTMGEVGRDSFSGLGFGMPGPFEYNTGIARFSQVEKYYSLNGVNVAERLRHILRTDMPLRFMNDASAFAVGEAWKGSASRSKRSVSITLGTGFGSAFIDEGVPVVDSSEVPALGCVWHLPYKDGIADDYFSTRWFIKRFKEDAGIEADGVRAIAEMAHRNTAAKTLFEEYGSNMGEFFAPWLDQFGAEILVIGGNIMQSYSLFGPSFESGLKNKGNKTVITHSTLKDHAAVIGSARMLVPEFWERIKPILPKM